MKVFRQKNGGNLIGNQNNSSVFSILSKVSNYISVQNCVEIPNPEVRPFLDIRLRAIIKEINDPETLQ